MNNSVPNQIVSKLFKQYTELRCRKATEQYYKDVETLKANLVDITRVPGAIEVMSKNSIIKLLTMQSTHRFMPDHSIYIAFSKAADDMSL